MQQKKRATNTQAALFKLMIRITSARGRPHHPRMQVQIQNQFYLLVLVCQVGCRRIVQHQFAFERCPKAALNRLHAFLGEN